MRYASRIVTFGIVAVLFAHAPYVAADVEEKEMVGTWEAIVVDPLRLFVVDLHQKVYDSTVTMVSSEAFVFGVNRIAINGRHVEIVCAGRGEASHLALKIGATGWAGGGDGRLEATMTLVDADSQRVHNSWAVLLLKSKLIDNLYEMRRAVDTVAKEKKTARSSDGSVRQNGPVKTK